MKIESCQVDYSEWERLPRGVFSCACGFVYSRVKRNPDDPFRYDIVISRGIIWERKLRELWENPDVNLERIARQLGVHTETVKKHAARLKLPFPPAGSNVAPPQPQGESHYKQSLKQSKVDSYRRAWLYARQEMPEASRTTLSRKYPKLYTWLSRRDQDWMEAHKPPSRKGTRAILSRVDWEGRDRQLAEAVTTAAKELRQVPGCPIRVTITAVANKIGYVLLTYRQKLPLTAQALAEVVETREAFAIRRVWWVAECYRQEGVCPARSQLVRRANVDALKALPEVQRVVEAALKMLGYNES